MALADGWTHKVTVYERPSGGTHSTATVATDVGVRIYGLKLTEVQAANAAYGGRVSHKLTAPTSSGIEIGQKLEATYERSSGSWSAMTTKRTFDVVHISRAEGGPDGAHHLVGLLSEATESG